MPIIKYADDVRTGAYVKYDYDEDQMSFLWGRGQSEFNVQIDPDAVEPGGWLHIATKDEVMPGSTVQRLFAKYAPMQVKTPEMCVTSDEPEMFHCSTICPDCVESWMWDYLIRSHPKFIHGQRETYDRFGCRCNECRYAARLFNIEHGITKGLTQTYASKYGRIV